MQEVVVQVHIWRLVFHAHPALQPQPVVPTFAPLAPIILEQAVQYNLLVPLGIDLVSQIQVLVNEFQIMLALQAQALCPLEVPLLK